MNWWRAHHGLPFDSKLAVVAKKCGVRRGEVLAVWIAVLDFASQHEDRGSVRGIDAEEIAVSIDFETDMVACILAGFRDRGMISVTPCNASETQECEHVTAWERRQVHRERDDDSSERVRNYRQRKKQKDLPDVTPAKRHVTPANAPDQTRSDQIRTEAAAVSTVVVEEPPPPSAAALKNRIREISKPPSKADHFRALSEYSAIREWLVAYPGAQRLPGQPDDEIVKRCLEVAAGDITKAAAALKAMNRDGKRPNSSWAYFPTVMQQYLGASA